MYKLGADLQSARACFFEFKTKCPRKTGGKRRLRNGSLDDIFVLGGAFVDHRGLRGSKFIKGLGHV